MSDVAAFHSFVIKVADRCNIDCDYCFVFNLVDQRSRHLPARLSMDVARKAASRIRDHAKAHELRSIHIALHGGEPLLVGPRYFSEILEVFQRQLSDSLVVRFLVQTNGTLITPAWLDVFERFNVSVGVSLDGPPHANDRHRLTHALGSTATATVRGIEALRSRSSLFGGILAVVDLLNDPVEVYDYLSTFDPPAIDFGLPHATYDAPPVRVNPDVPEYGQWMSRVYDAWLASGDGPTVRTLEDIVALSFGVKSSIELLGLAPPGNVVIESDGSIEGIDTLRAAEDGGSWLGLNVFDNTFDEALQHPKIILRNSGLSALATQCQGCSLVEICGGGHLPHRFSSSNGYENPSVYCADLMFLIRHIQNSLLSL